MMWMSKSFACFAALSLAAIPVVRGKQIPVTVGGQGGVIAYSPAQVTADPGDVVVFTFMQKNHTVTQSSLANPCQKLAGGFDSGFVPVAADNLNGPFPIAEFTVSSTAPVWAYCMQGNHCQQGMVFAINAGDKFDTFKNNAIGASTGAAATTTAAAAAATTTAATTTTSVPVAVASAAAQDHRIIVGGPGKLQFSPANITAQVGDTITFEFHQVNHTVTQSSFANPCQSLGSAGFNSGFMPVATDATSFPTYTVTVNSTSPVWAYCAQATHCGKGMVFAANVAESGPNTFEAFVAKAMAQGSSSSSSGGAYGGSGSGSSYSAAGRTAATGLWSVAAALVLGALMA